MDYSVWHVSIAPWKILSRCSILHLSRIVAAWIIPPPIEKKILLSHSVLKIHINVSCQFYSQTLFKLHMHILTLILGAKTQINCFRWLFRVIHGVWKSKKVSFNIASKANYVYISSGQRFIKNAKMVHFGEFLKTWSLRSNSFTRQVKNWWKMPKLKNSNATFRVIFKHCVL